MRRTSDRFIFALTLLLLFFGFSGLYLSNLSRYPDKKVTGEKQETNLQQKENNQQVLGRYYQPPQIYIYGGGNYQSASGGVIPLASTDEPAVHIGGYNISGSVEVAVYRANEDALLDYLTHDEDGKQTKEAPNIDNFQYISTASEDITTSSNSYTNSAKVTLPLEEIGIWYLKVKVGSINADAYVVRSNVGVLTKEGDNEFIFWGQNFKTKRSVSEGIIKILNLQDGINELQTTSFDNEGIARAAINAKADIALVSQNDDRAVVPINLKYLNTGYSYQEFQPKGRLTRYFIFTDRPLYQPGDTVYFKAILRDDDDARYSIPGGEASVKIYSGYYYEGSDNQPVYTKDTTISSDGTINGQYQLPEDADVGQYTLSVNVPNQVQRSYYYGYSEWSSNTIHFDVEYFRKPEFSIDLTTPQTELIAGDNTSFEISGQYFSGQPLIGQDVKYTIYSADFYEYWYLTDQQNRLSRILSDDYRYGSWYSSHKVTEGKVTLDNNGQAVILLDTKMDFNKGKSQVYSIEATIDDGSIDPSFARKNILVYAGEYGIYREDTSYGTKVNTQLNLPIKLMPYNDIGNISGVELTAKIHLTNWISYREEGKKYLSYRKEEEDLPEMKVETNNQGNSDFSFIPQKTGSYNITVEGKDSRGNLITKNFYAYVNDKDWPHYSDNGDYELTVAMDKQKYEPTDTVRFDLYSSIPDRDVFLSLERGRVNRFQIIHIEGKSGVVEVPLVGTDVPNIFAKIASFSDYTLDTNTIKVPVSTDGKKLLVDITPNSKTFGPGETVNVNISTTDNGGNPVSADVAFWAVDKAIFELSDDKLGDIFDTFWKERSDTTQDAHSLEGILVRQAEGGGCFARGTKILMSDGSQKSIEDVKVGDTVLTRSEMKNTFVQGKVTKTSKAEESGYLIISGNLKLTADHILRANDSWKQAGSIQPGDVLTDSRGNKVNINSIEWQAGKFDVYNLEVENYHTFFANGVWVHNQKGVARNVFEDTAYWNPTIHTDSSGRAKVSFKLPDNLTTWTLAAVGATYDTKVGQTTREIVVTKDVIVRPILPNILRTDDNIVLSAIVQNFTQSDQNFDVSLEFDSGTVEEATRSGVFFEPNSTQQFYWKVKPTKESDKSKLIFSALSKDNKKLGDAVTREIPVRPFGFEEFRVETGEGDKTFEVELAVDSHKEKSGVTLSISPTIVGTLPTAMKYLINYPYGCVEQTTSRFVPAVIAKQNQDLFAEALKDKDINDIIDTGLSKLAELQQSDGGWAWWSSGNSDPYITSYVVEYLIQARLSGVKVEDNLLKRAQNFLERDSFYDPKIKREANYSREDLIVKNYALTLLGAKDKTKEISDLNGLGPDILALYVMTEYLNGNTNPQGNGLNELVLMARQQGDALFWDNGKKENFGSKDASTALAIRAITLAGGDRNMAAKGVRYLMRTRNRQYWSNTYATAQVVRALVDFSKTGSELTPNYTYKITVDDKQISWGLVNTAKYVKEIDIPVMDIKPGGSKISISKEGEGQIYSTLLITEFHTDRNSPAVEHGLSVKREYINEKGSNYSLAVGDTVNVRITVGGLNANEYYGVIYDELPSGLIPVNQTFKNEQYGTASDYYYNSYDVTDRDITENGIVLSLYRIAQGQRTYSYKARVISEGTFIVPPAVASLMYAPEIYGRTEVQTISIGKESQLISEKTIEEAVKHIKEINVILISLLTIVFFGLGIYIAKKRRFDIFSIRNVVSKIFGNKRQKLPEVEKQEESTNMKNPNNERYEQ